MPRIVSPTGFRPTLAAALAALLLAAPAGALAEEPAPAPVPAVGAVEGSSTFAHRNRGYRGPGVLLGQVQVGGGAEVYERTYGIPGRSLHGLPRGPVRAGGALLLIR